MIRALLLCALAFACVGCSDFADSTGDPKPHPRAYLVFGHGAWPPDTVVADRVDAFAGADGSHSPTFWFRDEIEKMYSLEKIDSVLTLCPRKHVWSYNWTRFASDGDSIRRAVVARDAKCETSR